MRLVRVLRLAYTMCAFTGSIALRVSDAPLAHAQTREFQINEIQHDRDMTDRLKDKLAEIDDHVKVLDTRVNFFHDEETKRINEQSDRTSIITGVGVGVSATLGILQMLTMLAERKKVGGS